MLQNNCDVSYVVGHLDYKTIAVQCILCDGTSSLQKNCDAVGHKGYKIMAVCSILYGGTSRLQNNYCSAVHIMRWDIKVTK